MKNFIILTAVLTLFAGTGSVLATEYKKVVTYKTVTEYVTKSVPYTVEVTKYDHCDRPYKATVTKYKHVEVPVTKQVPVVKYVPVYGNGNGY